MSKAPPPQGQLEFPSNYRTAFKTVSIEQILAVRLLPQTMELPLRHTPASGIRAIPLVLVEGLKELHGARIALTGGFLIPEAGGLRTRFDPANTG
jgi:hypothetical protein